VSAGFLLDLHRCVGCGSCVLACRIENGRVTGIDSGDCVIPCDGVALTMQAPVAARLLPGAPAAYRAALERQDYLGVVCPLVVLERPLTGNWVLNIADTGVGLTVVIETTTFIDGLVRRMKS